MARESKVNLVLWKPDYEELAEKLKNNCDKQLCDVFDREGEWETPDETYVLLQTDWTKWYENDEEYFPEVKFIMDFIKTHRHAYVRFGDEQGEVETDYLFEDENGIDEEFGGMIEPVLEVTNLKLFGLEPKKYMLISMDDNSREITAKTYCTFDAAYEEMLREFTEVGENCDDALIRKNDAYVNGNHTNYDWKIVEVEVA